MKRFRHNEVLPYYNRAHSGQMLWKVAIILFIHKHTRTNNSRINCSRNACTDSWFSSILSATALSIAMSALSMKFLFEGE